MLFEHVSLDNNNKSFIKLYMEDIIFVDKRNINYDKSISKAHWVDKKYRFEYSVQGIPYCSGPFWQPVLFEFEPCVTSEYFFDFFIFGHTEYKDSIRFTRKRYDVRKEGIYIELGFDRMWRFFNGTNMYQDSGSEDITILFKRFTPGLLVTLKSSNSKYNLQEYSATPEFAIECLMQFLINVRDYT